MTTAGQQEKNHSTIYIDADALTAFYNFKKPPTKEEQKECTLKE